MSTVPSGNTDQNLKRDFGSFISSLKAFFTNLVDLNEGIDREGTLIWIKNNKRMRGANAWLLMCSIMIASLGLDLDSPAIIIGAMLISPLMSPILGVGMGIGTNDRESLMISLQHFGVSIAIALVTSYIYFWINPLGQINATKEIIDRTEPTLLAGIVAIFGGVAGIISASRKDQSNAIPGVAIATALMPPLCVAGYGLARIDFQIFWNAFYLFFLNSFFIAISTFALIRFMKFPVMKYQNEKESRRTALIIVIVSILLTLPSVLILKKVYLKKQEDQTVNKFITDNFGDDDNPQCLGYSYTTTDTAHVLALKLLGKKINQDQIASYEKQLDKIGVKNTKIYPLQDDAIDLEMFAKLQKDVTGYRKSLSKLEKFAQDKNIITSLVDQLQFKLDSIQGAAIPLLEFNNAALLAPEITDLSYGYKYQIIDGKTVRKTVFYLRLTPGLKTSQKTQILANISLYLKSQMKGEIFGVVIEE